MRERISFPQVELGTLIMPDVTISHDGDGGSIRIETAVLNGMDMTSIFWRFVKQEKEWPNIERMVKDYVHGKED